MGDPVRDRSSGFSVGEAPEVARPDHPYSSHGGTDLGRLVTPWLRARPRRLGDLPSRHEGAGKDWLKLNTGFVKRNWG
jgi:hypothetical protein